MKGKLYALLALLAIVAMVTACGATQAPAEPTAAPTAEQAAPTAAATQAAATGVNEITIMWAQWDPADYLQQVGQEYEKQTGIKVNVIQEPWGTFYDRVAAEWAAK